MRKGRRRGTRQSGAYSASERKTLAWSLGAFKRGARAVRGEETNHVLCRLDCRGRTQLRGSAAPLDCRER